MNFIFCALFLCYFLVQADVSHPGYVELPSSVLLKYSDVNHHDRKPKKKWKEVNVRKFYVTSRGSDGEFIDASNHFFWNKTDGIAMELGAVDGELRYLPVCQQWRFH